MIQVNNHKLEAMGPNDQKETRKGQIDDDDHDDQAFPYPIRV